MSLRGFLPKPADRHEPLPCELSDLPGATHLCTRAFQSPVSLPQARRQVARTAARVNTERTHSIQQVGKQGYHSSSNDIICCFLKKKKGSAADTAASAMLQQTRDTAELDPRHPMVIASGDKRHKMRQKYRLQRPPHAGNISAREEQRASQAQAIRQHACCTFSGQSKIFCFIKNPHSCHQFPYVTLTSRDTISAPQARKARRANVTLALGRPPRGGDSV